MSNDEETQPHQGLSNFRGDSADTVRERPIPTHWKFSLRYLFGAITLIAIEIWLMQQGPGWWFFVPLFITVGLEISGNRSAARFAAIVTLLLWLCFPCVVGMLS